MSAITSGTSRFALAAALAFGTAVAAPTACLFPSYTYDIQGSGGATGSGGSSSTGGGATTASSSPGSTGTGGTTSTSSGSAGSSTASSSSSTSGSPPCSSRICGDPACASSYACIPTTPPTGWTGYFALYDGPQAGAPTCNGAWPNDAYSGSGQLGAAATQCPCTCGNPSGGTCVAPELDLSDSACGQGGNCTGAITISGACTNFPDPTTTGQFDAFGGTGCGPQPADAGAFCGSGTKPCNVTATAGDPTVTGSSCAPSAPAPVLPTSTWGSTGKSCSNTAAQAGTGCGASDTCLPIPQGPFNVGVCIMQAGEVDCPTGQFTDQHIFYSGKSDTRGCSACTCGPPTNETCTVQYTLYSSTTNCTGASVTVPSGTCTALSGNPEVVSVKAVGSTPMGGSCAATDGTPTGSLKGTGPTTFCCIPPP